jgi:allantoin racemase
MASFCADVSREVGVPVIDGVAVATKLAESLVSLGLLTSTRGEYAPPRPKRYSGLLRDFTRSS